MEDLILHVDAEVNPTESEDKVKKAIENMFGNINLTAKPLKKGSILVAEVNGKEPLVKFYNLLYREHIRTAAKTVLLSGMDKKTVNFCLNKQVAFAGHVSFAQEMAESPLGPIRVRIECGNPRELVDWLTSMRA
jgi:predicted RNA binding protein with dsRBD fold (UPF0201 family)